MRPTAGGVRIDGVLDDEAWSSATVVPLEYEWSPGDNTPAVERTECLVTFDAERLLIAFRAWDRQPSSIRAHLADRDTAFQDDTVGFMLDPFNDERRAFQFRVNPLGVQMDAVNSDVDQSEDWTWDAIWESRGRITEEGYTVEVAIPFSSLRFPRTEAAQTWGFLAMRDLPRSLRHRMRSARTDRNRDCVVCQLDKVAGLQGLRPGRNLEFDPTLTAIHTDDRLGAADDSDVRPGLSARWGVTPNLALGAAVNPDFSQVEADVAQLSVNNRFALFFPEKRPLFLEGADLFETPLSPVFTRTVVDPDWGVKITGKEGRHALGGFLMRDSLNAFLLPSNQGSGFESLSQGLWSGVLRYRRDVGGASTVGLLYTLREGQDYHNHVGGLDALVRLSASDTLRFQGLLSSTAYPASVSQEHAQPLGSFTGHGYYGEYRHATRNWFWQARLSGLSPEFRADSGFVSRVDTRTLVGGLQRVVWSSGARWFTRLDFGAFFDRTEDYTGRLTDWGMDFPITWQGPRQTYVSYNPAPNHELFGGVRYDSFRHNITVQTRPSGSFAFTLNATLGETVDYTNGRPADLLRLFPLVEFSLARGLNGTLRHSLERLDVEGGRLFTANLTELRLVYHLNLRTFVRAILQYTDVDRDPALYRISVPAQTRRLFSQYLFSYKINPQTVLLLGYSDNYRDERSLDLAQTDRTLFFKVGYALVL